MMVKSNSVFLLLIVVQMLNYVSARRGYGNYDTIEVDEDTRRPSFGGYGDLRVPSNCDKDFFFSIMGALPSGAIRYKQRIMEINENPVEHQLKDDKSICIGPIEAKVHACDEENKPIDVTFNVTSNTVTIVRDKEAAKWGRGTIDVFQTCELIGRQNFLSRGY